MSWPILIRSSRSAGVRVVFGRSDYGYPTLAHAALPDRLYVGLDDASRPPSVEISEAEDDVEIIPSPLEVLLGYGEARPWPSESRRTLARMEALWLLTEDCHRTLDVQLVDPLAHQLSLVEHIVRSPELRRVLIADEVGLGKTIEIGLIIKRLKESQPSGALRVLYLAPAALVSNVMEELERLKLSPREWSANRQEARLRPNDSDPMVVASLHRAVYANEEGTNHFTTVVESGPWDVLVVDEAHHLTDWSQDGSSPQRRLRLVQHLLASRLVPGGRLFLLTGTPHQGHPERFQNLLRLLDPTGSPEAARGRIIYRTKDDILDWENSPLFPARRVHPPHGVQGGELWQRWFVEVSQLLAPSATDRASAWRRATALQWCASSPQAGLAFLVRFAVRGGESLRSKVRDAALALRPYRGGPADERLESLLLRLGEPQEEELPGVADPQLLERCLETGIQLMQADAFSHKLMPLLQWLEHASDEKFVVFAQPIETVDALVARLERSLGRGSVVKISGGVPLEARKLAQRAFREDRSVRVLVSSRAGGEGINLQVSRHLVHFDVPWNPMEMEQRVGRVHRYGSVRTIEVNTIVLRGSREERVLARARARLGQIVRDIDADHFERLFSRTMALVPLDELAELMAQEGFGELKVEEQTRLDRLVQEGFHAWRRSDQSLRESHARLDTLGRGEATHADLFWFLLHRLGARLQEGWTRLSLTSVAGAEPLMREVPAEVFEMEGLTDELGQIGRVPGIGLLDPARERRVVPRVGLNTPHILERVRRTVGEGETSQLRGAGLLRLDRASWSAWTESHGVSSFSRGCVLLTWLARTLESGGARFREVGTRWHAQILPLGAPAAEVAPIWLEARAFAELLRLLRGARFPIHCPTFDDGFFREAEQASYRQLRDSGPRDLVKCVFPISALWVDVEG